MTALLYGFGKSLDIGATLKRDDFIKNDTLAIKSDWDAIGNDLNYAIKQIDTDLKNGEN